jgi:DNA-directed RNA polymerase specialized sigma24 family protein
MPSLQSIEIPADVLNRARMGELDAHECIYRALSKPVYTLIRRLVIRPAVAEELLQDAFVEIFCSMRNYRASGSFLGWVRSIAVSKALMYLRSPWHRGTTWLGADGTRSRRGMPWAFAPAAVAAGLVATLTLLWFIRLDRGHAGSDDATIQSLVSRSQRLEAVLNTLPPRPTVERAATSVAIDELQTRIQILDQQLSAAADDRHQTQRLWSARVQLMNSLIYVRYAEAARNGDRPDHSPAFGAI